jgi:hypothetical protein
MDRAIAKRTGHVNLESESAARKNARDLISNVGFSFRVVLDLQSSNDFSGHGGR